MAFRAKSAWRAVRSASPWRRGAVCSNDPKRLGSVRCCGPAGGLRPWGESIDRTCATSRRRRTPSSVSLRAEQNAQQNQVVRELPRHAATGLSTAQFCSPTTCWVGTRRAPGLDAHRAARNVRSATGSRVQADGGSTLGHRHLAHGPVVRSTRSSDRAAEHHHLGVAPGRGPLFDGGVASSTIDSRRRQVADVGIRALAHACLWPAPSATGGMAPGTVTSTTLEWAPGERKWTPAMMWGTPWRLPERSISRRGSVLHHRSQRHDWMPNGSALRLTPPCVSPSPLVAAALALIRWRARARPLTRRDARHCLDYSGLDWRQSPTSGSGSTRRAARINPGAYMTLASICAARVRAVPPWTTPPML